MLLSKERNAWKYIVGHWQTEPTVDQRVSFCLPCRPNGPRVHNFRFSCRHNTQIWLIVILRAYANRPGPAWLDFWKKFSSPGRREARPLQSSTMDTKINTCFLSIFLKQHNFVTILIVISATGIFSTWRNLHLKFTIYENAVENELPCWQADDVNGWTRQC